MTGYSFSKIFNPDPGWYAGDFHLHSDASADGENSPAELADLAREEGLDFLVLTDHNTIDGFAKIEENLDFLFIPGIEVTLTKGHFNVFGMGEWRPWMEEIRFSERATPLPDKYGGVSELMGLISQEGYVNSINHPLLHPWDWLYERTDLGYVHCIELWNDLYWPDNAIANPKTVDLWTGWLNDGNRIVAVGGSDYHYLPKPEEGLPGERLGQPTTYVYAVELSVNGILDGVREGRAVVSRGPQITFQATIGSDTFMIGENIESKGGKVEFTAKIDNLREIAHAHLIRNGQVVASKKLNEAESRVRFQIEVDGSFSSWYRLDVLDEEDSALAITNPIFANFQKSENANLWDGAQIT